MTAISLELPTPPSVNAMFANSKNGKGRGRFPTQTYKRWLAEADARFLVQKWRVLGKIPVPPPCEISIRLPAKTRGDVSNRIKACEDYLVSRGITQDDKHNRKVTIERDETLTDGLCLITITPAEAA
jgi:crossover junction endodeoxyribonuclease RusA